MASNNPPVPPLPIFLTPFAKKYGVTPTRATFNALLNPAYPTLQKSLYTPILSLDSVTDAIVKDRAEKVLNLQRYRLKGFTSLALIEIGFVSEKQMRAAALTNPVHPLFARWRWESVLPDQIQHPIIDGNGVNRGVWDLHDNDLAWEIMVPSIRLASIVMTHLHTHPWFDALLLGHQENLDPNRFPPPNLLQAKISTAAEHKVFKLRGPGPDNAQECAAAFASIQTYPCLANLYFGMVTYDKGPTGIINRNNVLVNGFTSWVESKIGDDRSAIYIAYERAELLLRNDLSDSDRLCLQLLIANTLVHELTHAIGTAKRHRDHLLATGVNEYPPLHEPFFEDEVVTELGSSMDDAVWGGSLHGISETTDPKVVPIGYGILKGPQPILSSFPHLLSPPLSKLDLYRPIQVDYYEGIQQPDFWDFSVRNFCHFRPGQVTRNGILVNLVSFRDRDPPGLWQVAATIPEYQQATAPPNRATVLINRLLMMTPADRVAYANAKKQKEAYDKYVNLMKQRIVQTESIWDQVEMLTKGDLQASGYNLYQGLDTLLVSIEAVLFTATNMLLALDAMSDQNTIMSGRADARAFNRGLFNVLLEIVKASGGPTLAQRANISLGIVENARKLLTITSHPPDGISQAEDMVLAQQDEADCVQRIEDARLAMEAGDHDTANTMCEQVSRSMSSTLLTKCAARILMCHSDRKDHTIRLNVVSRTIETLQKAAPPEGRRDEHDRVLNLALQLQTRLVSEDQARRPNSRDVFIP